MPGVALEFRCNVGYTLNNWIPTMTCREGQYFDPSEKVPVCSKERKYTHVTSGKILRWPFARFTRYYCGSLKVGNSNLPGEYRCKVPLLEDGYYDGYYPGQSIREVSPHSMNRLLLVACGNGSSYKTSITISNTLPTAERDNNCDL